METNNKLEVILYSKYSLTETGKKKLMIWINAIIQPAIDHQHQTVKKMFLKNLPDSPPIYMS